MPPKDAKETPSKKAQIVEQYRVNAGDVAGAHIRLELSTQDSVQARIINILERLSTGHINTTLGYADAIIILQKLSKTGGTGELFTTLRAIQAKSRTIELGAVGVRREHDAEIKKQGAEIEKFKRLYGQLLSEKEEWASSKQAQAAKDLEFGRMKAELERNRILLGEAQKDKPELLELKKEFDKMRREYDAFKRTTGQGETDAVRELRQQVATSAAKITQLERAAAAGEAARKDLEAKLLGAQAQLLAANKAKEDSERRLKAAELESTAVKAWNVELQALVADLRVQLAAKPAVVAAAPAPVVPAVVNPDISAHLAGMEKKLEGFDKISAQLEALKAQLEKAGQELLAAQESSRVALLEEQQKLQLALEKCAADKDAAQAALNAQFAAIMAALKEAAAARVDKPAVVAAKEGVDASTQTADAKDMIVGKTDAQTDTNYLPGGEDHDPEPPITDDPIDFEAMLTAVAVAMFPSTASETAINGQKNQVFKSFVRGLSEALDGVDGREGSTSRKAFDAMSAQILAYASKKQDFIASLNDDEGFRNQFLAWAHNKAQQINSSSRVYNEEDDHSKFESLYKKYNQSPETSPAKPIRSWQARRTELDLQNIKGKISRD